MKRLLCLFGLALLGAPLLPAVPFAVDPAALKIEVVIHSTMHTFTAKLDPATVVLDGDPAAGTFAQADVRFAWADLKTGDTARDKEMLTWAGAAKNPGGHFVLKTLAADSKGVLTAGGSLELAAQTHDISFPVTVAKAATGWSVSGETKIDHRDWGLPKIRKFGMLTVDPVVTVRFTFVAKPANN